MMIIAELLFALAAVSIGFAAWDALNDFSVKKDNERLQRAIDVEATGRNIEREVNRVGMPRGKQ